MAPMSRTPDPRANGVSTNDYCALLPRHRYTHEAGGQLLLLPRTGLVVVPFKAHQNGGWDAAVVEGSDTYPRGGYHLSISCSEIETAIELTAGDPVETRFVESAEDADALPDGQSILTKDGYFKKTTVDGRAVWTQWLHDALSTAELTFPAKVLDTSEPTESASV